MKVKTGIGIFLDLSETDEFLLSYFKRLGDVFGLASLTLIHYVELDGESAQLASLIQQLPKPLEEVLEDEVDELVDKVYPGQRGNIRVKIVMGGRLDGLIEWVDAQHFNLVVFGKKAKEDGTGVFSQKVIRLTKSDCLFVPEGAKEEFGDILLALDFSTYSERVVERGINLSAVLSSRLHPVHVLKTGFQYFPFFKSQEKYLKSLRTDAEEAFKKLQRRTGLKPALICVEEGDNHISRTLHDYAVKEQVNLIVIGIKGRADEDDLLIGSVADRLVSAERRVAILIVKSNQ